MMSVAFYRVYTVYTLLTLVTRCAILMSMKRLKTVQARAKRIIRERHILARPGNVWIYGYQLEDGIQKVFGTHGIALSESGLRYLTSIPDLMAVHLAYLDLDYKSFNEAKVFEVTLDDLK